MTFISNVKSYSIRCFVLYIINCFNIRIKILTKSIIHFINDFNARNSKSDFYAHIFYLETNKDTGTIAYIKKLLYDVSDDNCWCNFIISMFLLLS